MTPHDQVERAIALNSIRPLPSSHPTAMQVLERKIYEQRQADLLNQMMEKKIEAMKQIGETELAKQAFPRPQKGTAYGFTLQPSVNGGYAVWLEGELFIARDMEELPGVIIAAVGRLKIKA